MQAVQSQTQSLEALQQHAEEIEATRTLLQTLPDKISYDAMVPFGRVAMFPGKHLVPGESHHSVHADSTVTSYEWNPSDPCQFTCGAELEPLLWYATMK